MKRFEQNDIRLLDEVRDCTGRIEVLEGPTGRRSWPDAEKARIVRESLEPGARVCDVADRNGMTAQHLSTWRSMARKGKLSIPIPIPEEDFPAFASLEITAEAPSQSEALIEIVLNDVTVRLAPETSATRIAEIAVALRLAR